MNYYRYIIVTLLISNFLTFSLRADDACGAIDLSNDPGIKDIQFKNQYSIGWCYAFALAKVISQKVGKPVSSVDIAIKVNEFLDKKFSKKNFEGVQAGELDRFARSLNYLCLEDNYTYPFSGALSYVQEVRNLIEIKNNADQLDCSSYKSSFFSNIKNIHELQLLFSSKELNASIDPNKLMTFANEINCKSKVPFEYAIETKSHEASWDDEESHRISAAYLRTKLNEKKAIFLGFDSSTFFENGGTFFGTQGGRIFGDHAATIVGKYTKNNKCFYKVNDSAFGDGCPFYEKKDPQIKCLKNNSYEVPEEILVKSMKKTLIIKD